MKADWKPENMILTVKFDTEKEAMGLYMILNHSRILSPIRDMGLGDPGAIRCAMDDSIKTKYAQYWDEFSRRIRQED